MHISYSRVSTYMRCPFSHYLSYVRKLTPKEPSRPLSFGSDFHKLLEHRGKKSKVKKALKDIKGTYYGMPPKHQGILGDDYIDDLKTIFSDYMKVYKGSPIPDVTEQKFEIEMGTWKGEPVHFVGVIDGLYHKDNKILIEEHKTFTRKPDANTLVMNMQKCLYAKAVQKCYGALPDGVIWDYIKSTPAKEPIWLEKSGKLSMAKSDSITPFSWQRACKRHNITDLSVIEQGQQYEGNVQNFFFRRQLEFTQNMVDLVWDSFLRSIKMICKYGDTDTAMNITKDCSWCSFQPICYAAMTGGNIDYTIDRDFTQKEEKEEDEKEVMKG